MGHENGIILGDTGTILSGVYTKWNGPVINHAQIHKVKSRFASKNCREILAEKETEKLDHLLMALPADHLAKFHKMTDAKEMWDAIKSRFGGNDESKKMQKYILKQQFEGFSVSNSEGLHKGYDSCPQLDHEDLEQLDEFNLEEMDLKWQFQFLFYLLWHDFNENEKVYKRLVEATFDAKEPVWFDKTKSSVTIVQDWGGLKALETIDGEGVDIDVTQKKRRRLSFDGFATAQVSGHRERTTCEASIAIKAYTQGLRKVKTISCSSKEAQKEKEDLKAKVEKMGTISLQNLDYPHITLQDKGIVDSGCSRHMTGNKAYLADYQDFNGGPVAFRGSKGYITGKGKIKTGKLDFEDVCFVNEPSDFNLLCVTDMLTSRTKYFALDSECLVVFRILSYLMDNQRGIATKGTYKANKSVSSISLLLTASSYGFVLTYIAEAVSTACYGLHQAPKAWTLMISILVQKFKWMIHILVLHKKSWCDEFEALMKSRFQMSSMGELTFFLGLQVKQKEECIFISQDKYIAEILKKFDYVSVKTASTPIETRKPLVKDEEASDVDVHLYRSMIGSLMYLTASRPDIMFAVCACSRFQVTPKTSHLSLVKRIFRYLKGKPKLGLWYPRVSSFDLEAYSNSDYARANLDRKSTTGEAEYVVVANYCGQVVWIQNQMLDYGFNFMNTKIYIDNESTICIVKNPVYHSKTKHIELGTHHKGDAYVEKLIRCLKYKCDNVVDFNQGFDVSRFQFLVVTIGMINP
ncbi:putative ribonuclease H-like domain-containing protein [Tanacetum coccineum]